MENTSNPQEESNSEAKMQYKPRLHERTLWMYIATFFILSIYAKAFLPIFIYNKRINGEDVLNIITDNIFTSFIFVLLPLLFKQIFGTYPIGFIKALVQEQRSVFTTVEYDHKEPTQPAKTVQDSGEENRKEPTEPINYQLDFIEQSRAISEKIYNRAGAYLMLGCSIAFVGLAVFSSSWFTRERAESDSILAIKNTIELARFNAPKDSASNALVRTIKAAAAKKVVADSLLANDQTVAFEQKLLSYLPRFGALFFIEFIAFFFLRQYRIMLEEYRYYEAIKRRRQDNLVLLNAIEANKGNPELVNLFSTVLSEASSHKLGKEETTQVLEVQKLASQELDLFGKLTELVRVVKAK
ncbi:MAG: hypothetical protein ACRYFX_10815 [Janthinobacterium lividum]